ncbi:hypothetical protein PtA15_10A273 [Puccinia triticina]|uniref:Uncharacterized protein n=1 Tax=Puccinia triticina TaxID=208348 RepID=A0ABY7CWM0_9BASI|nr:uncharacterized protein PtA15_10A273 [Puccinia triticina]WAQ88852.1 hypothetical protein PtA15_10A273 [Puccinia triticina]
MGEESTNGAEHKLNSTVFLKELFPNLTQTTRNRFARAHKSNISNLPPSPRSPPTDSDCSPTPAESCRLTPSHKHPADWSTRSVDRVKLSHAPLQLHRCKGACSLLSDDRPSVIASLQARAARGQPQPPCRLVDEPPSKPEHPADRFRRFRLFYDAPPSLVDCLQATSTRPTGPRDN